MDADDVGACLHRQRDGGRRAPEALVLGLVEHETERGLARDADEERPSQLAQLAEPAHHLEVLRGLPAEPEAGVEDQATRIDAGLLGGLDALAEPGADVADHVAAEGAVALVVHDHGRQLAAREQWREAGVAEQPSHVVERVGARVEGALGDSSLRCVDGDGRVEGRADRAQRRFEAGPLLVHAQRRVAGPCRLRADVDEVGALGDHARGLVGRKGGVEDAVAGEGVRRDVDDAHEVRAQAPLEAAAANLDGGHGCEHRSILG